MKCRRFSEEQIIVALREHDAGVPLSEPHRKHGVRLPCINHAQKRL